MASLTSQYGLVPSSTQPTHEVFFSGYFNKAGDDNNRWKRRYFQLILHLPAVTSSNPSRARLQYFENDKDALKGKPSRGELSIQDIMGIAVFGKSGAMYAAGSADAAIQSCQALTAEHVQDGPVKLILWGRDRMWRLAETSLESNVTGDLIRALDRIRLIPRVAVRAASWMRTQGTLSWNRRFALLLSCGDLLLFLDASLEQLRRRLDLARALDIKPLQPLVPAESAAEKRILKYLALTASASTNPWEAEIAADGYEFVGIRIRHPDIPEKNGYVMCVEGLPGEDTDSHYARFRKWIVQLQLSAAEARLSGFASRETLSASGSDGGAVKSESNQDLLERKLLQIVNTSQQLSASRESSLSVALPYLSRLHAFPDLWRSSLWYLLSGGANMKRNMNVAYSSLPPRDDPIVRNARDRIRSALLKFDPNVYGFDTIISFLLNFGGEECVFWTLASLITISSCSPVNPLIPSLQGHYHDDHTCYLESKVVLDILGLTNPAMVAHITAYDLSQIILESCTHFMRNCCLPQIWDGISVWGGDALPFAAVSLLAEKKAILECYSADEISRVVGEVFKDTKTKINWDTLDSKLIERIRRAQVQSLSDSIRDHATYISLWKAVGEETKSLGISMNQQLNRLYPCESSEDDIQEKRKDLLPPLHKQTTELIAIGNLISKGGLQIEEILRYELSKVSMKPTAPTDLMRKSFGGNTDDFIVLVETLFDILMSFTWITTSIAWTHWIRANDIMEPHCRFVPRASVQRSPASSKSMSSPMLDLAPSGISTSLPTVQPFNLAKGVLAHASSISSQTAQMGVTSVAASNPFSSPEESAAALHQQQQDSSRLKNLAIGLGKRLFQQRFLGTNEGTTSSSSLTSSIVASQNVPSSLNLPSPVDSEDFPPKHPLLEYEAETILLNRYKGGYIGLCELVGYSTDAAIIRDGQLANRPLIRTLDVMNICLRAADYGEKLLRWMNGKDPYVPVTNLPESLRRSFMSRPFSFHDEKYKLLTESLSKLKHRCHGVTSS